MTLDQAGELYAVKGSGSSKGDSGWETKNRQDRRDRRVNSVSVSDYSTLTMNTTMPNGDVTRNAPCSECGMFHGTTRKGGCPFWTAATKTFNILPFLQFRTVRHIAADGTNSINQYWIKKLYTYGFKAMGIHKEEDQKKIINSLKKAVEGLPLATVEERRQYSESTKRFANLAAWEESTRSVHVNAAVTGSKKPQKTSKGAERSRARLRTFNDKNKARSKKVLVTVNEEDDSSWILDEGDDEDSDSDSGSGDSQRS
jgi:hypothetical protein